MKKPVRGDQRYGQSHSLMLRGHGLKIGRTERVELARAIRKEALATEIVVSRAFQVTRMLVTILATVAHLLGAAAGISHAAAGTG